MHTNYFGPGVCLGLTRDRPSHTPVLHHVRSFPDDDVPSHVPSRMAGIPVQEEDRLFSWLSLRARSSSTPTEFVDKVLSDLTGADVQVELDIGLESDSVTSSKAFSCSCGSILYEPTTLKDGSSVCQSCWLKPDGSTKLVHEGESTGSESRPSVNVTLAGLVRKYLKDRVRAVELRMRASEVLAAGQEDTALQLYTEALQLGWYCFCARETARFKRSVSVWSDLIVFSVSWQQLPRHYDSSCFP